MFCFDENDHFETMIVTNFLIERTLKLTYVKSLLYMGLEEENK